MYKLLLSVLFFLFFTAQVNAQFLINEFLPDPEGEDAGAEWVELYNLSDVPASLNDCTLYLHDTDTSTQKIVFTSDDFIEKYKVISWDGKWLNNTGDSVRLSCKDHYDEVFYGDKEDSVVKKISSGQTIGRSPDGGGAFIILSTATMGNPNSGPSTPTPTKVPTNTATSKPSPTATKSPLTNVPSANPTLPVVKNTKTATPHVLARTTANDENEEGITETQTSRRIEQEIDNTFQESNKAETNKEFPLKVANSKKILPQILISSSGIIFMLTALFIYLKKKLKEKPLKTEINKE